MRWPTILTLALLSACNSGEPGSEQPPDEAADTGVAASGASQPEPAPPQGDDAAIPAAMQGRWGLVAADCEPGRADAKGLMVVDGNGLEFYESVAELDGATERSGQVMRATFDFTGEGMEWEREMTLTLENGGETLVRREYGDDAAPEPLEYTRCG
jgi:hypothetical protein